MPDIFIANKTPETERGFFGAVYDKITFKKQPSADEKIREILKNLLVTDWYLPKKSEHASSKINQLQPQPIFNQKTAREIAAIREMIVKSRDNEGRSLIPNLILKGKAGVGKTMLVEHLCRESGIGFIRIPSGAMENHLKLATHIIALHTIFEVAKQSSTPVYIIMDDGEELVAQRPDEVKAEDNDNTKAYWLAEKERMSDTIAQRRTALVNAILEESGKDVRKVAFAITTNRDHIIDKAFITRARVIAIDPPTQEERKQIIITHLPSIFNSDNDLLSFFNKGRLENMALKTEGFTGRNIVKMLEAIYACVQLEKGNITQEIIDGCIVEQAKTVEALQQPQDLVPSAPTLQKVPQKAKRVEISVLRSLLFPCC